jgi:hypothetical protein
VASKDEPTGESAKTYKAMWQWPRAYEQIETPSGLCRAHKPTTDASVSCGWKAMKSQPHDIVDRMLRMSGACPSQQWLTR